MIITAHAHARAGLVGNPSDGYFGKTISFIIKNFKATIHLWESPRFEIQLGPADYAIYDSVDAYLREQKLYGYYGGLRLIKAAIKRFHDHCRKTGIPLDTKRNFSVSYDSDIPRLVGLSGSSAIITATMRALLKFHSVEIPKAMLPTVIRSVEQDELGLACGLQDRVIQVYEGITYMDFNRDLVESRGYGTYEQLKPSPMPPIYVAYDPQRAEISDVPHRNLRKLWDSGDQTVHAAMRELAELTDRGRVALEKGDWKELGSIVDANYGVRQKIMNIAPENHRMVEVARSVGASSHFAGSGGAVTGLYRDGNQYQELVDSMSEIGCTVIRPVIYE